MELKYGNINFNADSIAAKNVKDFIDQEKNSFFLDKPEDERVELLADVHERCCKLVGIIPEPPKAVETDIQLENHYEE